MATLPLMGALSSSTMSKAAWWKSVRKAGATPNANPGDSALIDTSLTPPTPNESTITPYG
jgi:hypothetical protein